MPAAKKPPKKAATSKGGRGNTLYRPDMPALAHKLCLLGADNVRLGQLLEVSLSSIEKFLRIHPAFADAVKTGRDEADSKVAHSLYQRAIGYSHPDVDIRVVDGVIVKTDIIKRYPPDAASMIFWLKNRQKGHWRERIEHTGADGGPLGFIQLPAKVDA